MKRRVKAMLIESPTGVLKAASASDPAVEPGFLHRKILSEIETADGTVGVPAWKQKVWVMNSHFHGPKALRRRLYAFALSPEVVEAAERAGTEFPAPPSKWRRRSRSHHACLPGRSIQELLRCVPSARRRVSDGRPRRVVGVRTGNSSTRMHRCDPALLVLNYLADGF